MDFSINHACSIVYTHARKKNDLAHIYIPNVEGNISEETIEEYVQDFEVGKDFLYKMHAHGMLALKEKPC